MLIILLVLPSFTHNVYYSDLEMADLLEPFKPAAGSFESFCCVIRFWGSSLSLHLSKLFVFSKVHSPEEDREQKVYVSELIWGRLKHPELRVGAGRSVAA